MSVHSYHLLLNHIQFSSIHGPDIPGSYTVHSLQQQILLLSPATSMTEHHICFGPATSFILGLLVILIHSSLVVYWTSSDLRERIFWCCIFLVFYTVHEVLTASTMGWSVTPFSSGSHFVRTLCCGPSIHPGWPCAAQSTASLSSTNPCTMTRQWSTKGTNAVFLSVNFQQKHQ